MDIRSALKTQYRAALAMLRQAIERCPDEVWTSGVHPRNYWRIAYHTVFYARLYLEPGETSFTKWEMDRSTCEALCGSPEVMLPYTQQELTEYIDRLTDSVDRSVDNLDLDSVSTGFSWYPNMTKLEHQILNIRHLQGHVGQLSELLMSNGIDVDWMGKR